MLKSNRARRPQLARWILLFAVAALAAARPARPQAATSAQPTGLYGHNLIANGDAEGAALPPASWELITGELVVLKYGTGGGYPGPTSPGPANRGANFFAGGNQPTTIASQTVDISQIGSTVDAGQVTYVSSGYFGGFLTQADTAYLEVNFQDSSRVFVDQVIIGMPTAAERQNQTGLFFETAQGALPASTRFLQIRLHMDRVDGAANDGYADNLAFVIAGPGTQAYLPLILR